MRWKHTQGGFSLIELSLSLVVVSIITLGIASSAHFAFQKQIDLSKRLELRQDVTVLQRALSVSLGLQQRQLQGFYGDGASGFPLGRAIIPFVDRCADLTTDCPGTTSLFYASQKHMSRPLEILCALSAKAWVLDLSPRDGYSHSIVGTEVTVSGPDGNEKYDLKAGEIVSLDQDPVSVLFRVSHVPQSYDPEYDAATGFYADASFQNNPTCTAYVRDISKLYVVKVDGFVLPQTGSQTPSDEILALRSGRFPARMTSVSLSSIGLSPMTIPRDLEMRSCMWTVTGLGCETSRSLFRQVLSFDARLAFLPPEPIQFSPMPRSLLDGVCADESCLGMEPSTSNIPFLVSGESWTTLDEEKFSGYKLNFLSAIEFSIVRAPTVSRNLDQGEFKVYVSGL